MEIFDEKIIIDFNEQDNFLPFAGNIGDTFSIIEKILDENNLSNKKLQVLKNVSEVVEYLGALGNVHEQLVFDTAQLYVLIKHTAIDLKKVQSYFSKYAVLGANVLTVGFEDSNNYIKQVFDNKEFLYLSKIKIADYIFEIKNQRENQKAVNKVLMSEIKNVIKIYGDQSQKDLMAELKSIVE